VLIMNNLFNLYCEMKVSLQAYTCCESNVIWWNEKAFTENYFWQSYVNCEGNHLDSTFPSRICIRISTVSLSSRRDLRRLNWIVEIWSWKKGEKMQKKEKFEKHCAKDIDSQGILADEALNCDILAHKPPLWQSLF
jgi:hypothetical protein